MADPLNSLPIDPIVAKLRTEAAESTGGGAALVAGGFAVSFITVLVIVILLALIVGLPGLGWQAWIFILGLLYAGAAFGWLSARAGLFTASAFEYIDPRQEWAGVGRYGDGPQAYLFSGLDWLFIGPRMIVSGIRQTKNQEPPSRERFFDRCALMLRQLGKAGEAVPTNSLRIGEDETPAKLSPVLNYLDRADWIGLSSDRGRVWLSTKAKNFMMPLGLVSVPGEE